MNDLIEPLPSMDVIAEMRARLERVTDYYELKTITYGLLDLLERQALSVGKDET